MRSCRARGHRCRDACRPQGRDRRRPVRRGDESLSLRGSIRGGVEPDAELARELQDHVKAETAPYKYTRIVEFAESLPKTASGKIKRAELRGSPSSGAE